MKIDKKVLDFIKTFFQETDNYYYTDTLVFSKTGKTNIEQVNDVPDALLDELSPIVKSYFTAKNSLKGLEELINSSEWSLDETKVVDDGKGGERGITVKGTAKQLADLNKSLRIIQKNFLEIETEYLALKEKENQTYGNQTITKGQKINW